MKRKVVLHLDVIRVLTKLRKLEPIRLEFERSLWPPRIEVPMYIEAYDLDDLLVELNDICYKFTERERE